jgi:pilus assembly protein CpaF
LFGKRSTAAVESRSPVAEAAQPAKGPAIPGAAPPGAATPAAEHGRTPFPSAGLGAPLITAPENPSRAPAAAPSRAEMMTNADSRRSESYYEVKGTIFGALIEAIDLGQLARLDADAAREEIRDIVNEIIAIKMS